MVEIADDGHRMVTKLIYINLQSHTDALCKLYFTGMFNELYKNSRSFFLYLAYRSQFKCFSLFSILFYSILFYSILFYQFKCCSLILYYIILGLYLTISILNMWGDKWTLKVQGYFTFVIQLKNHANQLSLSSTLLFFYSEILSSSLTSELLSFWRRSFGLPAATLLFLLLLVLLILVSLNSLGYKTFKINF